MSDTPNAGPRRGPITRFIGRTVLRVFGWTLIEGNPNVPKAVFIASPHTSNLDGFFMIATSFAMGVKLSWMGKQSLFKFPLGPILRALGGVSVDRSKSNDTVQQIADTFDARPGMYLAIAPAGTRKKRDYWKSGFYHIAVKANVPLLCGCIDYGRKECGIVGIVYPTGDPVHDMDQIREVYAGRMGKYEALMTRVRLRGEDEEQKAAG